MSDKLTVGRVTLGGMGHGMRPLAGPIPRSDTQKVVATLNQEFNAPPKPPKRVAVQASVYADRLTVRVVITANDGTVWLRSRDNWERLPDLPQE